MVTGASEGIGRAFALRLALDGYRITALARNEARLGELLDELAGAGHTRVTADLSTAEGRARATEALSTNHHNLLINNAGQGLFGLFPSVALEEHEALMRVNMDAVVALAHAFLRQARADDALVNVSSALASTPIPSAGLYSATKAFVSILSECLWYEQRARGVYVLGLHPGPTATLFQGRARAGNHAPPAPLVDTPESVVEQAMAALRLRKKPTVVAGRPLLQLITFLGRFRSRRALVNQMGEMFPPEVGSR
jgi:short-subunit dehydrogenase